MIKQLKLTNFRNYADEDIRFDSGTNVLVGANGHGKTNVLEAIFFLSMLRSFRTASPREIRGIGSPGFRVAAALSSPRGYDKLLEVNYAEARRLRVDSSPVAKASEFIGAFKTVAFLPSDLMIVTEGAALRRRFVNMLICSFDKAYLAALNDYSSALRSRNSLLKNPAPDLYALSAFENIMATNGTAITARRCAVIKKLSEAMAKLMRGIKGDGVAFNIDYSPHPASADPGEFAAKLAADRRRDAIRKSASLGPHIDDFNFLLNGKTLRSFGSTGQCRLAALCLKLAALELLETEKSSEEDIVALVDDSTGELDQKTREAFFSVLSRVGQSFFTFTEKPSDTYFADTRVLRVENGAVIPMANE